MAVWHDLSGAKVLNEWKRAIVNRVSSIRRAIAVLARENSIWGWLVAMVMESLEEFKA